MGKSVSNYLRLTKKTFSQFSKWDPSFWPHRERYIHVVELFQPCGEACMHVIVAKNILNQPHDCKQKTLICTCNLRPSNEQIPSKPISYLCEPNQRKKNKWWSPNEVQLYCIVVAIQGCPISFWDDVSHLCTFRLPY